MKSGGKKREKRREDRIKNKVTSLTNQKVKILIIITILILIIMIMVKEASAEGEGGVERRISRTKLMTVTLDMSNQINERKLR